MQRIYFILDFEKVLMELRSSGIGCILFHVPQAYWKKSSQGSEFRSMADSREAAVFGTDRM